MFFSVEFGCGGVGDGMWNVHLFFWGWGCQVELQNDTVISYISWGESSQVVDRRIAECCNYLIKLCVWCLVCLIVQHDWSNKNWMIANTQAMSKTCRGTQMSHALEGTQMPSFPEGFWGFSHHVQRPAALPGDFFLWTPSKERTQQHFIAFLCWLGFVYIKGFTDTPSAPRPGDNEPFEVKVQAAVEFKTWGHVVFVGVQNKLSDKIVLQLMHGWNSWNAESLHSCLHIFYI